VIGLFKQKSPGNVIILLLFGLLIKLPVFLYPRPVSATANDGFLYQQLLRYLSLHQAASPLLFSVISFILLYGQALMLNFLVNEYRMTARQSYLTGMSYLMITSLLPEWNYLSAPLLASTFVIWMFIKLFRLYNSANARAQVYNIGLLAGISSFIYLPSALFIICIILGLMILKPFRLNELLLFVVGGTTPYYFFAIYLYLTNAFNVRNLQPFLSLKIPVIQNSIWLAGSTLLLLLPFLLGGYYVQTHLRKMLIQVRKNWSIMLLYLVLSFFVPFINTDQTFHTWVLLAAPFAAFHCCAYFYAPNRWLPLLLFFGTVGFVLYFQYGTPSWH
jgi:hypothetical protein